MLICKQSIRGVYYMKTVATLALKPGMILGEDVLTYKNELLLPKNTKVDDIVVAKLNRYSIMCVQIMEEADFATTHFEKVRVSEGFKRFEEKYNIYMPMYKKMINDLIYTGKSLDQNTLFQIYAELSGCAKNGELLLDYLYNMLPSEDDLTYAHCVNSALIAGVFGTWLGLPNKDIFTLIFCGFVYDIGKLLLPPQLIWKPDKLTDEEYEFVKTHVIRGYHIIKDQGFEDNIIQAALQHHERCDGTGYPNKLKDNEINQYAKYMSIIDAYEAMTSARTYRASLIPFKGIENFERSSSHYNSIILNPILQRIANSQLGMTVRLNNDQIAEIILINQQKLSRPLIKCGDYVIDLIKYPDLQIEAIL